VTAHGAISLVDELAAGHSLCALGSLIRRSVSRDSREAGLQACHAALRRSERPRLARLLPYSAVPQTIRQDAGSALGSRAARRHVRIFATSFSQSQRQCNARLCTSSAKLARSPHHRGDHAVRGRLQDNGCHGPLVERVLIHPRGKAEDPAPPRPRHAEDEAFIHEEGTGSAPANPQRPFDDSEVATGQCGQGLNRSSCCRSTSSLPRSSR